MKAPVISNGPILRATIAGAAALLMFGFQGDSGLADRLAQARNLGKAFFENPTTHSECVEQFKKALDLAPNSAREQINYGLALLLAAKTDEGIAELEKAQKQDPKIPHTWFNLGVAFEDDSRIDEAILQFQGMIRLVPEEPVSHYNLGVLYRLSGKPDEAVKEFELSEKYNPDLAGAHFALSQAWRQSRPADSARETALFQEIRKRQNAAGVTEDLKWSYYAEIYDPSDVPAASLVAPVDVKLTGEKRSANLGIPGGMAVADIDGDGVSDLIAWSPNGVQVFKSGSKLIDAWAWLA